MVFGAFYAKMRSNCRFLENHNSNLKTDRKFELAESFNQKKISGYWCHTCMLKPLEHGFWLILRQKFDLHHSRIEIPVSETGNGIIETGNGIIETGNGIISPT